MVIKRLILFALLIVASNAFAFDQQLYSEYSIFNENSIDNQVIFESFDNQFFEQDMLSFDSKSSMLRASAVIECPKCGDDIVDGVCIYCGYELGTGVGTEFPIGDDLWGLLVMSCIYFYYRYSKSRRKREDI